MRLVRTNANFWANKDRSRALDDAEALRVRIERIVAGWMVDTGYWDLDVVVRVTPAEKVGYLAVDAEVHVQPKALRTEAGGIPLD